MDQTLSNPTFFPPGATVKAYKASGWGQGQLPPEGAPKGVAVAEDEVEADGSIKLTGLTEGTEYFAAAEVGEKWRYMRFKPTDAPLTPAIVDEELAEHAERTEEVHGIADTSKLVDDTDLAAHTADTTAVHGIADTSKLAEDADVTAVADAAAAALAAHAADGTAVHGIADTAALALAADLSIVAANTQVVSYVLALADAGKVVELNHGEGKTITIPANGTIAFPVGTVIELHRLGAGAVEVKAAEGVTLRSPSGLVKLNSQYSTASLRKRAADEWVLSGDLA